MGISTKAVHMQDSIEEKHTSQSTVEDHEATSRITVFGTSYSLSER